MIRWAGRAIGLGAASALTLGAALALAQDNARLVRPADYGCLCFTVLPHPICDCRVKMAPPLPKFIVPRAIVPPRILCEGVDGERETVEDCAGRNTSRRG